MWNELQTILIWPKKHHRFFEMFECGAMQKCIDLVDLKFSKILQNGCVHVYLKKSALIQPRTSPLRSLLQGPKSGQKNYDACNVFEAKSTISSRLIDGIYRCSCRLGSSARFTLALLKLRAPSFSKDDQIL